MTQERKMILIGGAVLLLLSLAYVLTPVVQDLFAIDESLLLKEEKLMRYRSKVQEESVLIAREKSLQRRLRRIENGLLPPKTQALAAVDIQTMIRDIAVRQNAEVKTMRILGTASKSDQPYVSIPVEVTIFSSVDQLVEVLYGIETSDRLLNIVDLAARTGGRRKDSRIITTMTIEGYMKKPGA